MPYYQSVQVDTVPSSITLPGGSPTEYQLQTNLFAERVGFRSRPKAGAVSTLLKSGQAEPYSWLADYSAQKARTFKSEHPELAGLFKKDKGHNWDLCTAKLSGNLWSYELLNQGSLIKVSNGFALTSISGSRNPYLSVSTANQDLLNYSALEYGRTAPTADRFSASAFVGELREGLPALIPMFLTTGSKRDFKSTVKRQTRRAADAGNDYLNVQFGWIPLLNDVRSIATALATATFAFSGPRIETHRRRFKPEKDETISGSPSGLGIVHRLNSADLLQTQTGASTTPGGLIRNVWFSQRHQIDYSFEAEFVRLPEASKDYSTYLAKLEELMRWDLTPMDLWQLAPWSWLVDWFFDIGGQLDAWGSATSNRILSLYAYGMRDERLTTTTVVSGIRGLTSQYKYTGPDSVVTQIEFRRRQRIKANPFGFIPNPLTQLSAGQLGILGALGLTRTRR